jgi:hypothetical protein
MVTKYDKPPRISTSCGHGSLFDSSTRPKPHAFDFFRVLIISRHPHRFCLCIFVDYDGLTTANGAGQARESCLMELSPEGRLGPGGDNKPEIDRSVIYTYV